MIAGDYYDITYTRENIAPYHVSDIAADPIYRAIPFAYAYKHIYDRIVTFSHMTRITGLCCDF